jgi:UDP-N-acetylglucosamine 1-carboxyvinyltransferase
LPKAISKIETQVFPGFPTDLQPQIVAMLSIAKGTSVVVENLFESRFKYTSELKKLGADIIIKDKTAIIKGVSSLYGAKVCACDLRGGAAMVLAGLVANGYTTVYDVNHIDRGYYHIEQDLKTLGANIERISKV